MSWKPLAWTLLLAATAVASSKQELKPVAPSGWSMQSNQGGWVLKPDGLKAGQSFTLVFTPKQKAVGALKDFFEGLWATLGPPESMKHSPDTLSQKLGDWDFIRGNGALTQGNQSALVNLTALQKGDDQFSMVIVTDSPATFQAYGPTADKVLVGMLGVDRTEALPAGSSGFQFDAAFPADWTRQDGNGYRGARRMANDGRPDRVLSMYADEPIQGSLQSMFEAAWTRELTRAGIHLMNPGLLAPESPQPLKRRLKNGLGVWFEGGEGKFGQGTYCFLQLFMVPGPQSVTFIACMYQVSPQGTNEQDRAPVYALLESLTPATPFPKKPLFKASDCVGHWRMTVIAALAGFYSSSGAYVGDASSGGMEDLTLHPDGTYHRTFVGKGPNTSFGSDETGKWKVSDTILTLTPTSKGKVQKHRIYGKVVLQGTTCLLVGAADGSRIPTDALETGAVLEGASTGGSLLKYKLQ